MITRIEDSHPGIMIHKMPVGADIPGLIFAVGMVFIFLLAVPVLWYVLVGAAFLGIGFASLLHFFHNAHPCEECYSHVVQPRSLPRH